MKLKLKKPFDARLPGPLGKMTLAELNAATDPFDIEFSAMNLPTVPNHRPHPPKRRVGRPAKKPSDRVIRILVTLKPALLAKADARAKSLGISRAALIQTALQTTLNRRKSA